MKIVTHDSSFHTDDIFAVAVMLLLYPDAEVVRSRDPEVHKNADYVLDTGRVYDPGKGRFDHHMLGGAGVRENGIPFASFGLVWKEFGEKLAGGEAEAIIIDRELIQPIDAHDNGVIIAEYKFVGVRDYTIGDYFSSHLSSADESPERLHEVFMTNVSIAQDVLKHEIARAKEYVDGEKIVKECYESADDKRLIELPKSLNSWRQVLSVLPEPVFVIYPRIDGHWSLHTIPADLKQYGNNRKDLPASWAGKEKEELQSVTGVKGARFAHTGRFLAVANTREDILALAEIALNA